MSRFLKRHESQIPSKLPILTHRHAKLMETMLVCSAIRFKAAANSTGDTHGAAQKSFLSFKIPFLAQHACNGDGHNLDEQCNEIFSKGEDDLYKSLKETYDRSLKDAAWHSQNQPVSCSDTALECLTKSLRSVLTDCLFLCGNKGAPVASGGHGARPFHISTGIQTQPSLAKQTQHTALIQQMKAVRPMGLLVSAVFRITHILIISLLFLPGIETIVDNTTNLTKHHSSLVIKEVSASLVQLSYNDYWAQNPCLAARQVLSSHMYTFLHTYRDTESFETLDGKCRVVFSEGENRMDQELEQIKLDLNIQSANRYAGQDLHSLLQDHASHCMKHTLEDIYPCCFALCEEKSAALAQVVQGPLYDKKFKVPSTTWPSNCERK